MEEEISLNDHRHLEALQNVENVRTVTSNYAVRYADDIVIVDTTSGNVTVTLPRSRGGKKFCIVKASASNTVTILFSNSETMLGINSVTITSLADKRWFKGVKQGYIPL